MKTIYQAIKDELGNAFALLGKGKVENIIIKRSLNPDDDFDASVANDKTFSGVHADCLYSLVASPNISESDLSISLGDRNMILRMANQIYSSIGEEEKSLDQPNVYIGFKD